MAEKSPIVLTVMGRAELAVQDAASHQELLDRLDAAEAVAAVRRGLKDADARRVVLLKTAAARLGARHGL